MVFKKVPVNIITGTLGVGKTTAIASLLRRKPAGEHWAVLVNEFGALGIDAAFIEGKAGEGGGGGFTVQELAGGCMCCALSGPLSGTIATLVRRSKPDRLLIEPSGLGHPAGLLDVLRGEHLGPALDVRAIVCLVDPAQWHGSKELRSNQIFRDQVQVSDAVVANKSDAALPAALEEFKAWAGGLFPAKVAVAAVSHGEVALDLLDLPRDPLRVPLFPDLHNDERVAAAANHDHGHSHDHDHGGEGGSGEGGSGEAGALPQPLLAPGCPHRVEAQRGACGWIFSPDDVFDRDALAALLAELWPHVARVKGVFRVGRALWVAPALGPAGEINLEEICEPEPPLRPGPPSLTRDAPLRLYAIGGTAAWRL
mmetsp:Transcript_34979/g.110516  ORF Transcript_34979/g.110516 Transcript_34979/m.110516 type:complete len:368 (+) Transcript_34979:278-1381(+)